MTKEPELGEVEWLDAGPPERPDAGRPGGPWRWYALGFVALAIVVLVVTVERRPSHTAVPTRPTPSPTPTTRLSTHTETTPSSSPPPIAVTNLGHPLLDVPASWQLFARNPDAVLRIQLATGHVVRTETPAVLSDGPMALLAGPHEVIVKAWQGGGVVIRDGQPARELSGVLAGAGPILPGPQGRLWVSRSAENPTRMELVGFDGRRGEQTTVPVMNSEPSADGAGYLLGSMTGAFTTSRPGRCAESRQARCWPSALRAG